MRSIRDFIRIVEDAGFNAAAYWTPDRLKQVSSYASQRTFKTPEEAREWYFDKLQYWDSQSWAAVTGGKNGPEKNREIANSLPLYQSGKSFKIGKRLRKPKLGWADIDISRPSIAPLIEVGWLNPFDGYKVLGIQAKKVSDLEMNEDHSFTESGQAKVYRYAQMIKEEHTFRAIVISEDGAILDGHHRFRAVRDVLKWKTIPCLVVRIGDGETDLDEDAPLAATEVQWSSKNFQSSIESGEYAVVWVDVPKFEAMFQRDDDYVGPGGSGAAIGQRYPNFGKWLSYDQDVPGPRKQGEPVLMPNVYVNHKWVKVDGEYQKLPVVGFGNGRHRYSWMRDYGAKSLPVIIPAEQAEELAKLCGTSHHETRIRS